MIDFIFTDLGPIAEVLLGDAIEDEAVPDVDEEDDDDDRPVLQVDWQRFFGNNYRPLEGMKAVHHFRFSQDHPGVVFYKTRVHDDEKSANVLRNRDGILPDIGDEYEAPIPGLSLARQKYLYEKIREFCLTDESKDKTCPAPIE